MDVVNSVRSCLSSWNKGGESEWWAIFNIDVDKKFRIIATYSRNILISPHCNPSDPNCADVLTTAYHTLLCSTLRTWSFKDSLTADAFLAFVQSVLDGLPSSSSTSATNSSNLVLFGEIVVDMVWSIDAELEEIQADAKVAIANSEQGSESGWNFHYSRYLSTTDLIHISSESQTECRSRQRDPGVCREKVIG